MPIPKPLLDALARAHPSWHPVLQAGLAAMEAQYLAKLAVDDYLPTEGRLFAAFTLPLQDVRYVLVGEGPYPRAESATGVCFMDGAVGELWCETGLSKPVNKATSLRNFMKMLLVADGRLAHDNTGGAAMLPVAVAARTGSGVKTLRELQDNLTRQGFLLLNASLVFRHHVAPAIDAKAWLPFLKVVLEALAATQQPPALVLWGKIAEQLKKLPVAGKFAQLCSEHPYNLSFIGHAGMQQLFGPMRLLRKTDILD
jgi:uracil-DNA glycosylase